MSGSIIKYSRNTENAPKSSVSTQSVAFSHYNHISAQLPVDPKAGEKISPLESSKKIPHTGDKDSLNQCG